MPRPAPLQRIFVPWLALGVALAASLPVTAATPHHALPSSPGASVVSALLAAGGAGLLILAWLVRRTK